VKYTYAYKTRDGVRREGVIEAPSRDEAFTTLRGQGIRPIKVVAADGTKANGEIRGVRKRVVAAIAVGTAAVVGIVSFFAGESNNPTIQPSNNSLTARRQVIGDPAIIDKGVLTGWSEVFAEEGERFFASFAIPGRKAGQRNSTVEELNEALGRKIVSDASDGLEARQIKAMVEGMKDEARRYVAAGGTLVGYGKRLTERQDAEIAIYERVKSEIESARKTLPDAEFMSLWERRNDELRNLGIRTITLPE